MSLSFDPLLPLWLVVPVILVILLVALAVILGRLRGGWPRLVLTLAAMIVLLQPILERVERATTEATALLVVDESESQTLSGRLNDTRRAADEIEAQLSEAGISARRVVSRSAPDGRQGTALFSAAADALSDVPKAELAGVVLVTDGLLHDPDAAGRLASANKPVHSVLVGDRYRPDRRLEMIDAPKFGLVGKSVTVRLKVDDGENARTGGIGEARLTWTIDGQATRTRTVPVGEEVELDIPVAHRAGNVVALSVEPLEDEISTINNQQVLSINGVRDRLRVLLISGQPHPGERLWRSVLKSDPAVDLVHFTILRLPTSRDPTPVDELALIPFPTRQLFEEKLDNFDLIIFDRYTLRGVLLQKYLSNLVRYAREGGALLVATGPEYAGALSIYHTPLGPMLPARPTGRVANQAFTPQMTALGERHPVTSGLDGSGRLGWGQWYRRIDAIPLTGDTLMASPDGAALVVLAHFEEGRVAQVLSDHIWLWGRGVDGGGPLAELIRRMAHWLMKEPELEEEAVRAQAEGRRVDILRQTISEAETRDVVIEAPDGTVSEMTLEKAEPGKLRASFEAPLPGVYRVRDGDRSTLVAVGLTENRELQSLRTSADEVAALGALTGGGTYWASDGIPNVRAVRPGRLTKGPGWMGFLPSGEGRRLAVERKPLIPAGAALALLGGLLALCWWREAR